MEEYNGLLKNLTNEQLEKETKKAINDLDVMKISSCYHELNSRKLEHIFIKLHNESIKNKE